MFHWEFSLQSGLKSQVVLNLQAETVFLPLAMSFVEKAARAFGLEEAEALSLTLATEEIFGYLCRVAAQGRDIRLTCRGGGYYVEEDLLFRSEDFNMRAFNLTCSAALDDETRTEETGLLIASRMVDRFQFSEENEGLRLTLRKEKAYPEIIEPEAPEIKPLGEFSVRPPNAEELKVFLHLVNKHYGSHSIPFNFRFPGKIVDMVAYGEFDAALAVDSAGHIGGGVVWHRTSSSIVDCAGPYLFNQSAESDMAQALVNYCIMAIARTDTLGLMVRYATAELPIEYFESLGSLNIYRPGTTPVDLKVFYRHLGEDPGSAVWSHQLLDEILSREYRRLFLAREILHVRDEGETSTPFSVLSAEFNKLLGSVTLRPVWLGRDSVEVVAGYVETLLKEEVGAILFELDLGKPWQSHFTPALLQNGFDPRLILPYGGASDLVIFQHHQGECHP
jgi:anti-sigma regulatory factor (Ser/Thr protein kinase)